MDGFASRRRASYVPVVPSNREGSMRRYGVLIVVIALVAAGGAWLAFARNAPTTAAAPTVSPYEGPGEEEGEGSEEGGDPDAAAENHAGTVRVRNRVLDPSALAAAGWAGEVQIANEDTWEPYVAADPS